MEWPLSMSKEKAVKLAKNHDVIVGTKATYKPFVDEMKAANPDLTILVYMNGTEAQKDEGSLYPDEWYSKDKQGQKVRSKEFGNYLMDPSHTGWFQHVGQECKDFIAFGNYDGCMIDVLGTNPLHASYSNQKPINRATGREWTNAEWLRATAALAASAKRAVAPKLVYANGVQEGGEYYNPDAPSKQIMAGADGGMIELFLRPPRTGANNYKTEERWKKDVDMLVDAGSNGKGLLVVSKVWVDAPKGTKDSWHKYALASYYLGHSPGMYFSFLYDRDTQSEHPWWEVDLGPATGPYLKQDNVYQRSFLRGKALVNPTKSTYTVPLGGAFRTLDGRVVTSVVLGPNEGEVVSSSGGGPSPTTTPKPSTTPRPTITPTPSITRPATPTPSITKPATPTPTITPTVRPTTPRPSSSPSVPIPQVVHAREISMTLSKHLTASGRVTGKDGFGQCAGDLSVKLQRKTKDGWTTILWTTTNQTGNYFAKLKDLLATYRAVAVRQTLGTEIANVCEEAVSPAKNHRH